MFAQSARHLPFTLKCTRPVLSVLVGHGPPLELDAKVVPFSSLGLFGEVVRRLDVQTPEVFRQQNLLWRMVDAIVVSSEVWLYDIVEAIFDVGSCSS